MNICICVFHFIPHPGMWAFAPGHRGPDGLGYAGNATQQLAAQIHTYILVLYIYVLTYMYIYITFSLNPPFRNVGLRARAPRT